MTVRQLHKGFDVNLFSYIHFFHNCLQYSTCDLTQFEPVSAKCCDITYL